MLLNFRQGLVQHQIPTFFNITFPTVSLIVYDTNLVISFASGNKEYLHVEHESVANAWGPISANVDQWLYWDINTRTGERTFGITTLEPIVAFVKPTSVATDQHWFDQSTNTMFVWSGYSWVKKIRTFAFKLAKGRVPVSMSMDAPLFTGSQVGNRTQIYAGYILYDDATSTAVRDSSGNFITTEDHLTTNATPLSEVKLAGIAVEGEAQQVLAPYTIVYFTEFGKIEHATAYTASTTAQFGIIETSAVVGQTVTVVTHGMVSCPSWDWSDIGVNALLYCDSAGTITPDPMLPDQIPIATVLDKKTIQLGTPVVHIHNHGGQTTTLATEESYGIARLTVPADEPTDPVVVGDNDPRFMTYLTYAGGTVTGRLYLASNPTSPMEVATKYYVDHNSTTRLSLLQDVSLTTLAPSQVLWYDGTTWTNRGIDLSLGALSDVSFADLDVNQFLSYDGSRWVNQTVTLELGALSDVQFTNLTPNQFLSYDGNRWVNQTVTLELSALSDVHVSNVQQNDVVVYDGSKWVNAKTYVTANNNGNITIAPTPATAASVEFGGDTIAIGANALLDAAGVTDTIAIGSGAGKLLSSTTSGNVIVGGNDGSTITTDNNVLICDGTGDPKIHVDSDNRIKLMGSLLIPVYDMGDGGIIDPLNGAIQYKTITGPTSLDVVDNVPLGFAAAITLELTNGGSNVTWDVRIKWEMGSPPPLTAAGVDIISLYTRDGGNTWRGFFSSKDSK